MSINDIIQIFTDRVANKEKENVLLQAKMIYMQKEIDGLKKELERLESEKEEGQKCQ